MREGGNTGHKHRLITKEKYDISWINYVDERTFSEQNKTTITPSKIVGWTL